MGKRKISVGFIKPKTLEGNVIYVTLVKERAGISAHAVSAEAFNYDVHALSGHLLSKNTKNVTNMEGIKLHFRDYKKLLEEIVKKNNGFVDYSKAVKEGSEVYRVMREVLK
jgi:hypothetical protein